MVTPYKLGAYETVWEDDCSGCPAHVEFDSSDTAVCERQFTEDGVCFRGDWAADNDWFGYHFEFPTEWNYGDGLVDFTYEFKYWAVGAWENVDYGGAMYCTPTQHMAVANDCTDDMDLRRNSDTTCSNWDLWTSSGGDFDAYARFAAANNSGNEVACFKSLSYTLTKWTHSSLSVGFWVWDDNVGSYGLTGDISNEAWAVSDFKITFTPPPFASSSTSAPPLTTASQTTGAPQTTVSQTTGAPQTTAQQTTGPPVTTSNASRTTESGGGGGNSNSGVDSLIIIIAAVCAAVLIALVAAVVYWYKYIKTPSIKDLMTRGVDNTVDIKIEAAHREGEQVMAETLGIQGEVEGFEGDYQQEEDAT